MGRTNKVFLEGIITNILPVENEGIVSHVQGYMITAQEKKDTNDSLRTEMVYFYIEKKDILEKSKILKRNDIISIRGQLQTATNKKAIKCINCGQTIVFAERGTTTLVYVDAIAKRGSIKKLNEDGLEYLNECSGMSNSITIRGALVKAPREIDIHEEKAICVNFPIKVPRVVRNRRDDEIKAQLEKKYPQGHNGSESEKASEYPYVCTYGPRARDNLVRLHPGSEIEINGYIQGRMPTKKVDCPICQQTNYFQELINEIVPTDKYSIEYVRNCDMESETYFEAEERLKEEAKARLYV